MNVEEIFAAALRLRDPAARRAYVVEASGGDAALLARVEALLTAHDHASSFLEQPPAGLAPTFTSHPAAATECLAAQSSDEKPGAYIGRYKLLQLIGEGGFGSVWMAEQREAIQRKVALKIIKLGMDTRQVVARFEAERQALAMMDHPGIAKVFDAGATEHGRPYFVMELVGGVAISTYCDKHNLEITQRLALFAQVCQAVQHAHQKGLIHRDIKPGNILVASVDGRPVAKVIDFGIAKATQARLTEKTLFTEFRQLIGTPAYMSPEQAEGGMDVDTRSDVYSLGVLLYELLTGTTPFEPRDLMSKAYGEIQRLIREVDPPKPSTRLSQHTDTLAGVAAHRQIAPKKLGALVRGELDWIVMHALEKDRSRRYETASELATDVQRFLNGEPVVAAPASALYRARKFVRRHRVGVLTSAAVVAALIAGVVGTTIGLLGEAKQRSIAVQQAAIAQAIGRFQADMLASADPDRLLGDKVTVMQVMTSAISELDSGALKAQPRVEAAVRQTIGNTLGSLGQFGEAERQLRKAIDLRGRDDTDDEAADGLESLSNLLKETGHYDEAESLIRNALLLRERARPRDVLGIAQARNNLALILNDLGRSAEAETQLREAVRDFRAVKADRDLGTGLNNLGLALQYQGKQAEAESYYRESLDVLQKSYPPGHPLIASTLSNLAWLLEEQGKYSEAERVARDSLRLMRSAFPADHPRLALALSGLGLILQDQGRHGEAEASLREALDLRRRVLPPLHRATAEALNNVAWSLQAQGKFDDAETMFREALEMIRKTLPAGHRDIAMAMNNLGLLLYDQGRLTEAELRFRESLALRRKALPPTHPEVGHSANNLAMALDGLGKLDAAETLYREALSILRQSLPAKHPALSKTLGNLGLLLLRERKLDESEAMLREALLITRELLPANHTEIARTMTNLAAALQDNGKTAEAAALFQSALECNRRALPARHPAIANNLNNVALLDRNHGEPAKAEPLFREALEIYKETLPPVHPELALVMNNLALALQDQGKFAESEPLFRQAVEIWRKALPGGHPYTIQGLTNYARLLMDLSRFADAETLLMEAEQASSGAQQNPAVHERCVRFLVTLYTAWDQAEPGKRYDEAAERWRTQLPTTQPAATRPA